MKKKAEAEAFVDRWRSTTFHRRWRMQQQQQKRRHNSKCRFMMMIIPYRLLFFGLFLWILVQYRIMSSFLFTHNAGLLMTLTQESSVARVLNNYSLPQQKPQKPQPLLSDSANNDARLLESMNQPAIPTSVYNPKSTNPLQVVYISGPLPKHSQHDWLLDALERSRYIHVVAKLSSLNATHIQQTQWDTLSPQSTPLAILVDWAGLKRDCHALHWIMTLLQLQKRTSQLWKHQKPYLLLLDSTASTKIVTCNDWPANVTVHIAKRSIVAGRRWNFTRGWIEPGQIVMQSSNTTAPVILQWTGSVSESFVKELRNANNQVDSGDNNRHLERTWDISHFWQATTARSPHGGGIYHALRQTISMALNRTASDAMITYADYLGFRAETVDIDMEGEVDEDGYEEMDPRTTVLQLVSSKIVVVSQSDEYEDHDDRLFEALASGALVLADTMVAPPAGLKNKTNIIFYNNPLMLDQLIRYYLKNADARQKISRHGMEYALGRHRSWHVLEKLLFGKALTRTDKSPFYAEGPAKRKHAMEESKIVSLVL